MVGFQIPTVVCFSDPGCAYYILVQDSNITLAQYSYPPVSKFGSGLE